jgi:hypothetical protein
MLIDMLRDVEKKAEPAAAAKSPFSPTDKEVVQGLITRLRRNMCAGCPWAARQQGASFEASLREAPQDEDITSC